MSLKEKVIILLVVLAIAVVTLIMPTLLVLEQRDIDRLYDGGSTSSCFLDDSICP